MAKGMKTGGRTPGVPNKFHSERAARIEREGKRLPPANLLLIAENSMAMAARFQPEVTDPATREKRPNPEYDQERYAFWLDRSREALRDAAPLPRTTQVVLLDMASLSRPGWGSCMASLSRPLPE
jgi:hypothetical protein